ncbi:MAG: hypothetical protein Q4F35_08720, partial [Akkermansia sp.]|nr:hypothetical protein [Akkermansia sp.]
MIIDVNKRETSARAEPLRAASVADFIPICNPNFSQLSRNSLSSRVFCDIFPPQRSSHLWRTRSEAVFLFTF